MPVSLPDFFFRLPVTIAMVTLAVGLFGYMSIIARLARMLFRERPSTLISFLPLANILGQTLAWINRIPVRIASQRNPVQTYSKTMQVLD